MIANGIGRNCVSMLLAGVTFSRPPPTACVLVSNNIYVIEMIPVTRLLVVLRTPIASHASIGTITLYLPLMFEYSYNS